MRKIIGFKHFYYSDLFLFNSFKRIVVNKNNCFKINKTNNKSTINKNNYSKINEINNNSTVNKNNYSKVNKINLITLSSNKHNYFEIIKTNNK